MLLRTLVIRFIITFIYCDQYCTATIYSATRSARGTHIIVYVFPNKQSINVITISVAVALAALFSLSDSLLTIPFLYICIIHCRIVK